MMLPEWIDQITSIENFFSPCDLCSHYICKSSARDLQANYFVVGQKGGFATACSHCRPQLEAGGAVVLQIRRSSHHGKAISVHWSKMRAYCQPKEIFSDIQQIACLGKYYCCVADVVKIQDLNSVCPEAVLGIQSYTINGQKVAFIRRRAVPKEARTDPKCLVCYRGLQDVSSVFCSLECKKYQSKSAIFSPSPASSNSDDSPSTPAKVELSFNSHSSSSSGDVFHVAKRRRKSVPRRSPAY